MDETDRKGQYQSVAGTEVQDQADQVELRTDHALTRETLDARTRPRAYLGRCFGTTVPPAGSRKADIKLEQLFVMFSRCCQGTIHMCANRQLTQHGQNSALRR